MKKRTYDRMIKKVHEINLGYLGTNIAIKKLKPLSEQSNYNRKLKEWFGEKEWDIVLETKGEIDAFKESEVWHEAGTVNIHDYKCKINDNLGIDFDDITKYIVVNLKNKREYEIIFYREFIGEVHIGLRPVINT